MDMRNQHTAHILNSKSMTELKLTLRSPEIAATIVSILSELSRAEVKHPTWPVDNVKRAAIVCEEAGEVIREANLLDEGKGSLSDLKIELIQCAGTCIRMLNEMNEDYKEMPGIIEYFEERSVKNGRV